MNATITQCVRKTTVEISPLKTIQFDLFPDQRETPDLGGKSHYLVLRLNPNGQYQDTILPWVEAEIANLNSRGVGFTVTTQGKLTEKGFFGLGESYIDKVWIPPSLEISSNFINIKSHTTSEVHLLDIITRFREAGLAKRTLIMSLTYTLQKMQELGNCGKTIMQEYHKYRDWRKSILEIDQSPLANEFIWEVLKWSCKDREFGGDGRSYLREMIKIYIMDFPNVEVF